METATILTRQTNMQYDHDRPKYQCLRCGESCSNKANLLKHLDPLRKKNDCTPTLCHMSRSEVLANMKRPPPPVNTMCSVCGLNLMNKRGLDAHTKRCALKAIAVVPRLLDLPTMQTLDVTVNHRVIPIIIYPYGFEELDYISDVFYARCIKDTVDGFVDLMIAKNFHPDHLYNHNVRDLVVRTRGQVEVYDGTVWRTVSLMRVVLDFVDWFRLAAPVRLKTVYDSGLLVNGVVGAFMKEVGLPIMMRRLSDNEFADDSDDGTLTDAQSTQSDHILHERLMPALLSQCQYWRPQQLDLKARMDARATVADESPPLDVTLSTREAERASPGVCDFNCEDFQELERDTDFLIEECFFPRDLRPVIDRMYFCKGSPKNMTIRRSSNNVAEVVVDGMWQIAPLDKLFDKMIRRAHSILKALLRHHRLRIQVWCDKLEAEAELGAREERLGAKSDAIEEWHEATHASGPHVVVDRLLPRRIGIETTKRERYTVYMSTCEEWVDGLISDGAIRSHVHANLSVSLLGSGSGSGAELKCM